MSGWKTLQLPNKRDQERTLHLINELHHRLSELETKIQSVKKVKTKYPLDIRPDVHMPLQSKKKTNKDLNIHSEGAVV